MRQHYPSLAVWQMEWAFLEGLSCPDGLLAVAAPHLSFLLPSLHDSC